ncbi:MAG TPA: hypothetical protein VHW92_00070 [Mycobacteriales bacterium]|nr:hypothetical protein [Mycobacteriales bacterium]
MSVAGASASGGVSGGCARTVTVTSDGGHRLEMQPSASRLSRGECVRFANPTQIFVTVRIGSGYAVDLPPGTLTGPPGRADYQARNAGIHLDTVTDVSPVATLPSGTGTITVVAAVSRAPSPTASPRPPSPTASRVAPVTFTSASPTPSRRRAHSRSTAIQPSPAHTWALAAGSPTPLATTLPGLAATRSPAPTAAALTAASGASASNRRTRLVGVAVLLIVVVASALLRTQAAR